MIRLNRGRVIGILLTGFIIYFLFLSSANSDNDFRKRTEEGLSRRHGVLQGDLSDEDYRAATNKKLDEILAQQGQKPIKVSDEGASVPKDKEGESVGSVAGRKTVPKIVKEAEKPRYPVAKDEKKQKQESLQEDEETKKPSADPGKDAAREKLQEYMKKPLIIFSKSYCPHSKRAKHLLLDIYKIVPAPLVVELDQLTEPADPNHHSTHRAPSEDSDEHERPPPSLGQKLQELLAEVSGRRTVPNIMVGTTSIGGNDLIWNMHEEGTLAAKIKSLGGKRIVSVEVGEDEGMGAGGR